MLIELEKKVAEPSKYEIARAEIKKDIEEAFDKRVECFEIAVDGMKPSYIKEHAKTYGERYAANIIRGKTMDIAREKGLRVFTVSWADVRGILHCTVDKEEGKALFRIDFGKLDDMPKLLVEDKLRIEKAKEESRKRLMIRNGVE